MTPTERTDLPRVYTGRIPALWPHAEPLDVLLTVFEDGSHELATRPAGERWTTWGAPVVLVAEPIGVE